jgi:hypothetical protein
MRKFLIAAGIVLSFTACSKNKWDQAISDMEGLKDRMCKCTDKACVDKVEADSDKMMEDFMKKVGKDEKPPKELDEKADKIQDDMRACRKKALGKTDDAAPPAAPATTP